MTSPSQTPVSDRFAILSNELTNQPKVWLITGAAGFIGSNLVERLLSLGQTVVGLDNFSTGHRANLEDVLDSQPADARARFRMVEGDIRDLNACRDVCEGADFILHQAALGSVPRSIGDPVTTAEVNFNGFLNLLVAAKDAKVKRLVYASSSSVYGDATKLPQVEEHTGRVLSPYAATKAADEMFASVFQRTYGLETVGLRYFNVFGRRQDPNGPYAAVIPRWVTSLLDGGTCHIYGDGQTSRDFCYIENVLQANLLAAALPSPEVSDQVYNIACGRSASLVELFMLIRAGLAEYREEIATVEPAFDPFRPGDIRHSQADIGKARRLLGYEPTHYLADGLGEALPWYARAHVT